MISSVARALKHSLAIIYDESDHISDSHFAHVSNLAIDATSAINRVLQSKSQASVSFPHHSSSFNILRFIPFSELPRSLSRRAATVHSKYFLDCIISFAQVVFDAFNIASYRRAANHQLLFYSLTFNSHSISSFANVHSAYRKLTSSFRDPSFIRGSISNSDHIIIDHREHNFYHWYNFSKRHPWAALEFANKIGNARLISCATRHFRRSS